MAQMQIRDASLFVKVLGQGYPLVLMHGGPGVDHSTLLSFRPLADRFTLVFYDHRGNGRSQGAAVSSMTWENLTADAEALRQALGFERWAVLGHSFGGMVALEYALRYPQSLSHLLLVDTCGDIRWAQEHAPAELAQRGYSQETVELASHFFRGEIAVKEMFPAMMKFGSAYYHHLSPRQMAHELAIGLRMKSRPEALIFGFGQLLKGWTVMERLGEITAPTLVMAGREDFQFPPEHQAALAAGIPNARLQIIDLAGHNAPSERPAEVNRAVADFIFAPTVDGNPGGSPKPAACFDEVDAYVQGQTRRLNIPGASLAIVQGDRVVHRRGFGRARPDSGAPGPQTPFFIGSLTKSFTALAVMQLAEAGKIELDAPIQRYLPWFRVADAQASAAMTVRHLLNQTSGLPLLPSEVALADFDDSPNATERQVRALSTLKTATVGSKCMYSNLNYNILGLIIETASGEPYADYIQGHIFDPLGMSHSFSAKAAAKQNGLAMGHRHWFGHPMPAPDLPVPRASLPSGQLISCAEDMAHYLIAHLNGGRFDGVQILSSAGMDELHRGVAEYVQFGVSSGRYGMGWFDIDLGQTKTTSHAGNVPDFSAFMALIPEQNKGVILLFNADPYGLPPITMEVGMGVTALLAGQQPAPIKLNVVPWLMRLLPLLPLLQIAGAAVTLRTLQRWRLAPALRPGSSRVWGRYVVLPLIPNLLLAACLTYLRFSGLIRFLHLFLPDLAWIARISGGFAAVWAFVRTGLILQTLRQHQVSEPLREESER